MKDVVIATRKEIEVMKKNTKEYWHKQGKADAIEEIAQTIRKIEADTTLCIFDCPRADEPISCTICVLERAVEEMQKGEENE